MIHVNYISVKLKGEKKISGKEKVSFCKRLPHTRPPQPPPPKIGWWWKERGKQASQGLATQSVVQKPAAMASPKSGLEMQKLRPHPGPIGLELWS